MFKHILVPLDGSALAEAALAPALYLARTLEASVTLFHGVERRAPQAVHGEPHLATAEQAGAYLSALVERHAAPGLRLDWHVHTGETGDVAASIAEHIVELAPDLIVMAAHGKRVLRTWVYGTIAERIISACATPILLVNPAPRASAPAFECRRVLAPLDGNPEHEQGAVVALGLAAACRAELHLAMIVHSLGTLPPERAATARLLPGAMAAWLEQSQADAVEYLGRWVARGQAAGLAVTTEVRRGDPAKAIMRTARRVSADVVVLGTHGRSALDAFWSGSVAMDIARRSRVPLLLVPVRRGAPLDAAPA